MSRKSCETRQKIIDAAMKLFESKGSQAVRIDHILNESKTGKSQFYHFFKSKDDLTHQCIEDAINYLRSPESRQEFSFKDKNELRAWMSDRLNLVNKNGRGCLWGKLIYHLQPEDDLLQKELKTFFVTLRSKFAQFFSTEQAKGLISTSLHPDDLAYDFLSFVQGATLLAKIEQNSTVSENQIDRFLDQLYS